MDGRRDTAAAVVALLRARPARPPRSRHRLAQGRSPRASTSWRGSHRRSAADARRTRRPAPPRILGGQNPDGGFGAGRGYASDPLDTALALRALRRWSTRPTTPCAAAIAGLRTCQRVGGGWPAVVGRRSRRPSSPRPRSCWRCRTGPTQPPAQAALRSRWLAALLRAATPTGLRREPEHVLRHGARARRPSLRAGGSSRLVDPCDHLAAARPSSRRQLGRQPLRRRPSCWQRSAGRGAQPGRAPDSLVVDPPTRPAKARWSRIVAAAVRNTGRVGRASDRARLYDGHRASRLPLAGRPGACRSDPGESAPVASTSTPPTARATAPCTSWPTPRGQVSRVARGRQHGVARAPRRRAAPPDLVVQPADARRRALSAGGRRDGRRSSVTVRNPGERALEPSLLRVVRASPRLGGAIVVGGDACCPVLARSQRHRRRARGTRRARKASYALVRGRRRELRGAGVRRANNETSHARHVSRTGTLRPGADLELASLTASPASIRHLPQVAGESAPWCATWAATGALGASRCTTRTRPRGSPSPSFRLGIGPRSSASIVFTPSVTSPGDANVRGRGRPDGGPRGGRRGQQPRLGAGSSIRPTPSTSRSCRRTSPSLRRTSSPETWATRVDGDRPGPRNRRHVPVTACPCSSATPRPAAWRASASDTLALRPGECDPSRSPGRRRVAGDPLPLVVRADPFGPAARAVRGQQRRRRSVSACALPRSTEPGGHAAPTCHSIPTRRSKGRRGVVSARRAQSLRRAAAPVPPCASSAAIPTTGGAADRRGRDRRAWTPAPRRSRRSSGRVDVRGSQALFVVADAGRSRGVRRDGQPRLPAVRGLGLPDLVLAAADVRLDRRGTRAPASRSRSARTSATSAAQPSVGSHACAPSKAESDRGRSSASGPIPALAPGRVVTLVELPWTPASPPGESAARRSSSTRTTSCASRTRATTSPDGPSSCRTPTST